MIDINNNEKKIKGTKNETTTQLKENISKKEEQINDYKDLNINNNNNKNKPNEDLSINLRLKNSLSNKDFDNHKANNIELINSKINKVKTFDKGRRKDRFGNMIKHGGKQKVTFIDRVTKNNFTEVVKIENYKEFNKMEEPTNNHGNGCCLLL